MFSLIICSQVLKIAKDLDIKNMYMENNVIIESGKIVPIVSAQIPMVPFQYKEQLKVGSVIQLSLVEFCEYISKNKEQ